MMRILPALVAVAMFSGCGGVAPTVASDANGDALSYAITRTYPKIA